MTRSPRIRCLLHRYNRSTERVPSEDFTHQTTSSASVCRREPVIRSGSQQIFRHSYWPDALHNFVLGEGSNKAAVQRRAASALRSAGGRSSYISWRGTDADRTATHRPHEPVPAAARVIRLVALIGWVGCASRP